MGSISYPAANVNTAAEMMPTTILKLFGSFSLARCLCPNGSSAWSTDVLDVLEWLLPDEGFKRPGISETNDRRPGSGLAARDVESKDDEITSYLKRSAKAVEG
jgi:hypothetical protein